jgi:hypothetical protein
MAEKTSLPPKPKVPTSPQAPKVSGTPGPKLGLKTKSLLRVFKPLLFLPLLAIAAILVYFFVPEKVGHYSLNLYCLIFIGILTGILLLYVLVRFVNYLVERSRIKKQEELLGKAEVWRVQESLADRWDKVGTFLKSAGVGLYDMPWYLMVGGADSGAQELLEGSALTFPDVEEAHALSSDPNVIDRWVFANEGVFIDTTARSRRDFNRDSEKAEWEAFLRLLARHRSRSPINGILLTVSAFELANESEETRRAKVRQILYRLRSIQQILGIRVPLYLVITQMERILGFSEFFGGLEKEEKEQILGWSNPNTPDVPFSSYMFFHALEGLTKNLREQRLTRLAGNISQDAAHRAFLFPEEFASLSEPLADYVKDLFKENRFAEEPLFRGFYFSGGREPGSLATLYNKKHLPPNVLTSIAQSAETGMPSQSLFINDLFTRKILVEPGLVTRPKSVLRKNLKIKSFGAAVLMAFFIVSSLYLFSFAKKAAREIEMLGADIREAQDVLLLKKKDVDMLPLCIRLSSAKKRLKRKGYISRIFGLGRYDLMARDMGVIHRSLFQETSLKIILNQVEDGLHTWQGDRTKGDPSFYLFSAALIEYTKWSNPTFRLGHPLDIKPFLDFLLLPSKTKYQYLDQFQIYLKEGGRGRRIVGPSSEEIIRNALGASRVYLRPTRPDTDALSTQLSEAQWWLGLATQLRQIQESYNALLSARVPAAETPLEEMTAQYGAFRGFLYRVISGIQDLLGHIEGGRDGAVLWIDPENFYEKMRTATRGMPLLETAVERDKRIVARDYNERVKVAIIRLAPLINLLSEYPSHSWLVDVLARAFGPDFTARASDLGVGNMIEAFLTKVVNYNLLIEDFYASFPGWRESLPIQIGKLENHENPLRSADLNLRRDAIEQRRKSLADFAFKPTEPEPQTKGQPSLISMAKPDQEQQDEEKRKAVVSFWQVLTLSSRIGQWLEVQDRMRMYIESLYLREIFKRGNFEQDILHAKSWYDIKNMEIFRRGDGIAIVTPISDFLDQWIQYVPQSMKNLTKGNAEVKHYPELSDFEKLLKEVTALQQIYMGKLRMSASKFAKCIQAMDTDVGIAWQTLRNSPGPDGNTDQLVSWKNLQNLTLFRESLEIQEGPIARPITSQLVDLERHVFKLYKAELVKTYQSRREQIFKKYKKLGIRKKFPFQVNGPQLDDALLQKFFHDLNSLTGGFGLEEGEYRVGPNGEKVPLSSLARSIAKDLDDDQWRGFYNRSRGLDAFLFDKGKPRSHKFEASMVPGPVGSSFHWVRIAYGNGTFKDLNVYGEPTTEMTLVPKDRSVTIQGLDAAKTPQASKAMTKGGHAFLQMVYLHGRSVDEARKTWLVDVELPMSENPSFSVKSTFKFVFKEALPVLPHLKDIKD